MVKQVIVMRKKFIGQDGKSFSLRRGKEIAQGSHASMAFLTRRLQTYGSVWTTEPEKRWLNENFTKVCVVVDTEEELVAVHEAAIAAGIESHLITDAGATEFNGVPTKTCCAIGPDYVEKVDPITGKLKLY